MSKNLNLEIGSIVGDSILTLISRHTRLRASGSRGYFGLFRCECGTEKEIQIYDVTNGKNRSCGCMNGKWGSQDKTTHGMGTNSTRTPEYTAWANMIQRCTNTKRPGAKDYILRGISMCSRWRAFKNFAADMGMSNGLTLDRIDNNGNYEPGNCRWATRKTQAGNQRDARALRTHCPQNHPYYGENLILTKEGHRECRACVKASRDRSKQRREK